jgi:site-specific DNA-methyltransferase (adenine-specific)
MTPGDPNNKGIRKDQFTGIYGDFEPRHVNSKRVSHPTDFLSIENAEIDYFNIMFADADMQFYNNVVYNKTAESEGKLYHPTQKPDELRRFLIRASSNEGDIVLDPFFGRGTTGKVAKELNRK